MGLDGVDQVQDRLDAMMEVELAGSDGLRHGELTLVQLRRRLQALSDLGSTGRTPTPGERRLLVRSVAALRRRLERFNQSVPVGLKVELNPAVVGWLAEAALGEA